jgi:peptidoglycan lytic transglycosylase G
MAPLFGGHDDGPRSAADREAARLERERRRAAREGRPVPDDQDEDGRAIPPDAPAPFEWDAPGAHDPHVSAPRPVGQDQHELWEPEPPRSEAFAPAAEPPTAEPGPETWDREPRDPERADGQPGPQDAEPEDRQAARQDVEPEGRQAAPRDLGPEDRPRERRDLGPEDRPPEPRDVEPGDREPRDLEPEPEPEPGPRAWRVTPPGPQPDPEPRGWPPAAGAAPAWNGGNGDGANGGHAGTPAHDDDGAANEHAGDQGAARAHANGAEDPQDTQPFDSVAQSAPARRTVSLPRPQTDTGEWDAPIGTVRVSRGGGGGAGGRYQAQPGASGYPPYRKLAVKPRRRWLRRTIVVLALLIAIAACVFAFLLFQPRHGTGHGAVVVTIPAGATADDIGKLLADRGVVNSSFFFSLRSRLSGDRAKLRSGRYTLREGMSYGAALTALTTPPKAAPVVHITLPEGPSRREEAPKLRAAGVKGSYLAATKRSSQLDPRDYGAPRSTRTLEGFLFPSTYELKASQSTARRLVSRQLAAFKENFAKVDMTAAKRRNLSPYDVLIIASMIEREALVPRDRRLIAAVIYNRLKDDIPLGIDATLRYGLNQWSRPLRVSELNSNSAFNTRKRRGLPPTPIGNPGLAALRAAANPAHVPYLFYVVKPCADGAHAFSSTDAKFAQDVARYNQARAKRGGKDPSHC